MSDSKRSLDIVIAAHDETVGGVKSAQEQLGGLFQNIKQLNAESRQSGEMGFERLLKGGGAIGLATFAMEGLAKGADALRESLHGVADGTMSVSQGVGHTIEAGVKAVPVLGGLVEGFTKLSEAGSDIEASFAEHLGISHEWAEQHIRSGAAVRAEYEAMGKVQKEVNERLREEFAKTNIARLTGLERELAEEDDKYEQARTKMLARQHEELKAFSGHERERHAIIAGQDNEIVAMEEGHAAARERIQREADQRFERAAQEHEKRLADIERQGREHRLRAAGLDLDAELSAIAGKYESQIDQVVRQAAEEMKQRPDKEGEIFHGAAVSVQRLEADRDKEKDEARADNNRRAEQEEAAHLRHLRDARDEASAATLRAAGDDFAAEKVMRDKAARDRIDGLEQEYRALLEKKKQLTNLGGNPDEAGRIDRRIEQVRAEADLEGQKGAADQHRAEVQRDNRMLDRGVDLEHERAEIQIGGLRQQEELGNKIAGQEADRLEKVEELKRKHDEIVRRMREEHDLTDKDRDAMRANAAEIEKQIAIEQKRPLRRRGEGQQISMDMLPRAEDDSHMHGDAQAALERMMNQKDPNTEKTADGVAQLVGLFKQTLGSMFTDLSTVLRNTLYAQGTQMGNPNSTTSIFGP